MDFNEDDERNQDDSYIYDRNILLRNYQLKILEQAKTENSIIYLPTGAGKTLIAIHVLCSKTEEIKRPFCEGGKRAFFLTPTRVMVNQLTKVIHTHTKFNVVGLTGETNVDCWSASKWSLMFEKNQVFVITGEILRVLLTCKVISPSNISLLVLDECHHAMDEHPYKLVLQAINASDPDEAPLILGLTSILIKTTPKVNQIEHLVSHLETSLNGKIITEKGLKEVLSVSANPSDELLVYEDDPVTPFTESILKMYGHIIQTFDAMIIKLPSSSNIPDNAQEFTNRNHAKRIKKAFGMSQLLFEELGPFGGSLGSLFLIIKLEKMRLLSNNPTEIQALVYARTELIKIRRAFQNYMGEEESIASIFSFSSHKIRQLLNVLKMNYESSVKRERLATIIFVKERLTAMVLAFLLKRLGALGGDYSFLKPDFVVGTSHYSKESFFLGTKNEETVRKFSASSLNVLVATNLLEEGVDISACNVVISFDFPIGYPSYFQSRGRARDRNSVYIMFVKNSEMEAKRNYLDSFKRIEEKLREVVCRERESNENDELSNEPPEQIFIPRKFGTISLDGIIAIKVVQRYCSKLPQDRYSYLSPTAWYTKVGDNKKAFVQLPVNSRLREVVEGEERATKKMAKRSAFLCTVKKLYEMGELDDSLNPKSLEADEENFDYLFPHFRKEKIDKSLPQPGTSRRKQKYKMKFAASLSGCLPRPGIKAYLHVIKFTVTFDKPPLERKVVIRETLQTPTTFALLTSKKLFKILKFPIFLDMGQIDCDLLVNYDEVVLTESEINDIKECHFAIFKKVTNVLKSSQIFDNRNKEHSFFVVPVEKNEGDRFVLNWDLIRCDYCKNNTSAVVRYNPSSIGRVQRKREAFDFYNSEQNVGQWNSLVPMNSIDERLLWANNQDNDNQDPEFLMTESDYRYFVIFPNYRNQDFPQRYIVNKFCWDMSPLSPFPRAEFEDYASYYQKNYAVDITNVNQPLLRVSAIYNCSNFNKPRTRNLARDRSKNYEEHLVPELCDVIPFDRRFFLKALLLPTVLARIYHVYCVEEFRRKIVLETGLGTYELPEGTEWTPLDLRISDKTKEENSPYRAELALPLTKLKNETHSKQNVFLDPERHVYEVGLCDLEFYVAALKEIKEEELKENEEIRLFILKDIPVPPLNTLKNVGSTLGPDLSYLIQACTSTSANDSVDYERLEILGDSLLKFATTLFLFKNFNENEGVLTALKGKIVGNRNLFYCALAKDFPDVINVNDFSPLYDWNPPLICIPEELIEDIINEDLDPAVIYRFEIPLEEQFLGVLSEKTLQKNKEILRGYEKCYEFSTNPLLSYKVIADKTVSDCVEAFIGAYLLASGMRGAFDFLIWLQILPKSQGSYSELVEKPYLSSPVNEGGVLELLRNVFYSDLEETLNYHFRNKALLLEAITHPSYSKNRVTDCYQRLEFLGDAILDFLITSYVYEYCGDLTPGQVTDIRSSLVNNITFACLAVRYNFYKYLLSFSSTLISAINNFVSFQIGRNHVIDENVLILLKDEYPMAETVQVPKALGDVFESLAGAIYLDSGNSLETVWKVYYAMMKPELDEFTRNIPKTPVRLLHEICGDKPYFECTLLAKNEVMVSCTIYYDNEEIKTFGFGLNKKDAKRSAAKIALNKILTLKN